MSITITTDVFCDICSDWTFGAVGGFVQKKESRANAKKFGWKRLDSVHGKIDVCPRCYEKQIAAERLEVE